MSAASVLDELLGPFGECLDGESARRVMEFRIPPHLQQRVEILAERANEGLLTDEERDEYDTLIDVSDVISILKLKVQGRGTESAP
jgi:hypothetical protein